MIMGHCRGTTWVLNFSCHAGLCKGECHSTMWEYATQAEVTHLDGQRLGRDGEAANRQVLRTREEAEAVVARIESTTLRAASLSQKVRSLQI